MLSTRTLALALSFLFVTAASAQVRPVEETEEEGGRTATDEARPYDELVATFQKDYLRFTTLVQVAPVIPFEEVENNQARFDLAAAWFGVGGRLGENVGYFVRADFARSVSLLEAYVSYGSDDVRGIVGRQKVPFSAEFLTAAADIDFVNRARAVRALVPGRETGVALDANLGPLDVRAGVFNATYTGFADVGLGTQDESTQQERGGVALAGRVQSQFALGEGALRLGASVAYDTGDNSDAFQTGDRLLVGADARLRLGALLLAGEYVSQDRSAVRDFSREGGYATIGVDLSADDRVLFRLDSFGDSQEGIIGYNRAFTPAASFQANLVVPFEENAEPLQAVLNFQLAF